MRSLTAKAEHGVSLGSSRAYSLTPDGCEMGGVFGMFCKLFSRPDFGCRVLNCEHSFNPRLL